jgi:hypothetical protein
MPANTLNDMILGYAVILGILLMYILTIIIRTRKARHQQENQD